MVYTHFECLLIRRGLDPRECPKDRILVANKATRVLELDAALASLSVRCLLTRHGASALRGRLQFAEGQVSSRCGRVLSARMADLCKGNGACTAEELTEAIRMLRDILATSGPRVVCMRESEDSVLIFTDGAFEAGVAT